MVGKSKPASAAEKKRMGLIKREAWCIPCVLNNTPNRPETTIQHVVDGYRLGHQHSYGCCGWHHLGIQHDQEHSWSRQDMLYHFGPSLYHGKKEYENVWGEESILVELQDYLIELYLDSDGWSQYHLPLHIKRLVRVRWQELRGLR